MKEKKESWRALSDRACELIEKQRGACVPVGGGIELTGRHHHNTIPLPFLFYNPVTNGPYRTEFLRKLWRRYSGVEMRLYDATRHSWVTQMIEAGAHPMELGIHSNERTVRNYFHPSGSRQHELANRRGKVISLSTNKAVSNKGSDENY